MSTLNNLWCILRCIISSLLFLTFNSQVYRWIFDLRRIIFIWSKLIAIITIFIPFHLVEFVWMVNLMLIWLMYHHRVSRWKYGEIVIIFLIDKTSYKINANEFESWNLWKMHNVIFFSQLELKYEYYGFQRNGRSRPMKSS